MSRCLDSVLNNTYRDLEVICINDGSTDESADILRQYAEKDERIIAINQENAGVSAARNAGLDMATGDFVAFVDSDDWVHPQYFEILLFAQKATGAEIVACRNQRVNCENHEQMKSLSYCAENILCMSASEAARDSYLKRLVWGKIYKRSIIKERFEPNLSFGEDTVFNLCTLGAYGLDRPFSVVQLPLYFYFSRAGSLTGTFSSSPCIKLSKWYLENWKSGRFSPELRACFLEQAAKELLSCRYIDAFAVNPIEHCELRELIAKCKSDIKSSHLFTLKKRSLYSILFAMPSIYRIFRIINDPTLIQYEKQMKAKMRTALQ